MSAVRSRVAAHWSSWADCVHMIKQRHPKLAETLIMGIHRDPSPCFVAVRHCQGLLEARELQTCTFERPGASNTTKIQRKRPKEGEKNENCGGRGIKKREILGPPPFGAPLFLGSGPPPFGAPTLRGPHLSGPPPFEAPLFWAPTLLGPPFWAPMGETLKHHIFQSLTDLSPEVTIPEMQCWEASLRMEGGDHACVPQQPVHVFVGR